MRGLGIRLGRVVDCRPGLDGRGVLVPLTVGVSEEEVVRACILRRMEDVAVEEVGLEVVCE
jgi:hypothetical protein